MSFMLDGVDTSKLAVLETATYTFKVPGFSTLYNLKASFKSPSEKHNFDIYIVEVAEAFKRTIDYVNHTVLRNSSSTSSHIQSNYDSYGLTPLCSRINLELVYNDTDESKSVQPLRFRVSVVDGMGIKHHPCEYFWKYQKTNLSCYNYNSIRYLPKSECLKFVFNNTFTLYFEVDILDSDSDVKTIFMTKMETLLFNEKYKKFSDFSISVGTEKFPVHRALLAAHSPMFRTMFDHSETVECKSGQVVIEDIKPEVIRSMLTYIYTGIVSDQQLKQHVIEILKAAHKYQIKGLVSLCADWLSTHLKPENVSDIFPIAVLYQLTNLKIQCINFLCTNKDKVIETFVLDYSV